MKFISKKGKYITITGIILLFISIAGVFYVLIEKEGYLISDIRDETSAIEHFQILEGDHTYEIQIGVSQTTTYEDAIVEATFVIYIDGVEEFADNLNDWDALDDEDDTSTLASDSRAYFITRAEDVNLTIIGEMILGDVWHIKIYQDVPSSIIFHLFLVVGIMFTSVVIMLGGIYVNKKAKDYTKGRTDAQMSEAYHS